MNDFLSSLNSRAAFLAMKARMVGLTPEESAEWERIKSMRVRRTPDGTIWVEDADAPQSVEDWKRAVAKARAAPAKLLESLENKAETDAP